MSTRKIPGALRSLARISRDKTEASDIHTGADYTGACVACQDAVSGAQKIAGILNVEEALRAPYADEFARLAITFRGKPYSHAGLGLYTAEPIGTGRDASGPGPLRSFRMIRSEQKPRQITRTTQGIIEVLWRVATREKPIPANVAIYLHHGRAASDMNYIRLVPMIDGCALLRKSMTVNNVGLKQFDLRGVTRSLVLRSAGSSTTGDEGAVGIGSDPTDLYFDEYQRHPKSAEAIIRGGTGWRKVPQCRYGTPLTPSNQLTEAVLRGTHYMSFYLCPHCGHSHHPEIDINTSGKEPEAYSASVGANPDWDGVTTHEMDESELPCDDCRYPPMGGQACKRKFKCRELIMVCPKCGGSLEHLRGRAGIFEDDGVGIYAGGVAWARQGEYHSKYGDSWEWTRYDVAFYSMAHVFAKIQEAAVDSGVRLATNEEIGQPYSGSEGCMVQRVWTDAGKSTALDCATALRSKYLLRVLAGDWGGEEGAGSWAGMFGFLEYENWARPVLLDAEQFSGDFMGQGERMAAWGAERGMGVAMLDFGHCEGRERAFWPYIKRHRTFLVDHSHFRAKTEVREWRVTSIEDLAKSGVFKIPKARSFDHVVSVLRRGAQGGLLIPWRHPEELGRYIEHFYNLFRGAGKRAQLAMDGLEVVGDEVSGFRKGGPVHFLDVLKFALLVMYSSGHFGFFRGVAEAGSR